MWKKLLFTGCALFLLSACGADTAKDDAGNGNNTTTANQAAQETAPKKDDRNATGDTGATDDITNPPIAFEEALQIFKEAHPTAKVESIDFDDDDGRWEYEFEGFDAEREYEMDIDAVTGEVREREADQDHEDDESLDFTAIIVPARAIEIASTRDEVKGLTPTGWTLEADDGRQKYTIEYDKNNVPGDDDDIEVKIDAVTEEIIKVDMD